MTDQTKTPTFSEMDDVDAGRLALELRAAQPSAGDSLWAAYRGQTWAILRNSYGTTAVAVLRDGKWIDRTKTAPAAFVIDPA